MFFLRNIFLVSLLILYHIKIVSTDILNLSNLVKSGFKIEKIVEGYVIRTLIYSTSRKKITEIRKNTKFIWEGQHGEKAKCVTYITSKLCSTELMAVEVEDPQKSVMIYISTYYSHYRVIDKELFEEKLSKLVSSSLKEIAKHKTKKPRKRKRTGDTDDTEGPKKKPAQSQQLEPEITHVEISSDDETDTASEVDPEDIMPHREEILDKLKMKIQKRMKEKSQPPTEPEPQQLLPEVVQVEMESDDESTDTASEEPSEEETPPENKGPRDPSTLPLKKRPYKPE